VPSHHHGHAVGGAVWVWVTVMVVVFACVLLVATKIKKSGTKMAGRKSCTTPTSARSPLPARLAVAAPANNIYHYHPSSMVQSIPPRLSSHYPGSNTNPLFAAYLMMNNRNF
jgi:hypothetical protein